MLFRFYFYDNILWLFNRIYIHKKCFFTCLFRSNMFGQRLYNWAKKYNNNIIALHSIFAEDHKLILGDWFTSFGSNFFSENMKLRQYLTLFMLPSDIFVMKRKSNNHNDGKISLNCYIICGKIFTPHILKLI